jgi:exopolysaccharide biosynthesis polyprenyl glycosylphosphotransferase
MAGGPQLVDRGSDAVTTAAPPPARTAAPPAFPYRGRTLNAVERRARVLRRSLAAADLLSALAALAAVTATDGARLQPALLVAAPLVIVAAKLTGLYDRDELVLHRSTIDELPALCRLAGMSGLLIWLAQPSLGRLHVAVLVGALLAFVFATRAVARALVAEALPAERCLFVGDQDAVERLDAKLRRNRARIVGFRPLSEAGLERVVEQLRIDRVIVAPGAHADSDVALGVISRAKALGAHVSIVPRMLEVVGSSVEFDHVDGLVMLGVHRFGLTRSSALLKRAMDLVGAGIALVLTAPLMVVAAVAIRLETPGPVLFRQRRVGRNGRPFTVLKFRSMVDGSDHLREQLRGQNVAGDGLFKLRRDPRVTRVGAILRRTSLDELPQLVNVLRGEMSLVGPRPLVLEEDRLIVGWHRRRLHLTPGLTGPWQVLGSGEARVPLRDMVTIDYLYAANWSAWSDAKVLLRTVAHVFRGRGV